MYCRKLIIFNFPIISSFFFYILPSIFLSFSRESCPRLVTIFSASRNAPHRVEHKLSWFSGKSDRHSTLGTLAYGKLREKSIVRRRPLAPGFRRHYAGPRRTIILDLRIFRYRIKRKVENMWHSNSGRHIRVQIMLIVCCVCRDEGSEYTFFIFPNGLRRKFPFYSCYFEGKSKPQILQLENSLYTDDHSSDGYSRICTNSFV